MPGPYLLRSAIFDLDGTLVDSSSDIKACILEACARRGIDDIAARITGIFVVGPPLPEMLRSLLPELAEGQLSSLIATFRSLYDNSRLTKTFVYPGASEALERFRAAGGTIMVATNKPGLPTRRILAKVGLSDRVDDVVTADDLPAGVAAKSDMVRHLIAKWNLERSQTIVVGDMPADIEAAHANGGVSAAVLYGYGDAQQLSAPADRGCWNPSEICMSVDSSIFDELFVLEMANNHWGNVDRGLRIVRDFGRVVRFNNMKAAIKLQFRDVDSFIHKDFINRTDVRYIKKTLETKMAKSDFARLVQAIRQNGCIPAATPFDERSVDLCLELGIKLIKLASSDVNDWVLIEKVAKTRLPVMASLGGSSLKDTEDLVTFFANRHIPLAINHCVSLYPTEDHELELNQIDFLRRRFPKQTVRLLDARVPRLDFVDADRLRQGGAHLRAAHRRRDGRRPRFSRTARLPWHIDAWFRAFKKAKAMCGTPGTQKRIPSEPRDRLS